MENSKNLNFLLNKNSIVISFNPISLLKHSRLEHWFSIQDRVLNLATYIPEERMLKFTIVNILVIREPILGSFLSPITENCSAMQVPCPKILSRPSIEKY